MWAGGDNWLDQVSKAWPVVLSLGGIGAYFIGLFARSKANDKEIVGLTKTVETLVKAVSALEDKQNRSQSNIEFCAQRTNEACKDIAVLRDRADRNASNIDYMLGRMDFGTRQRKDPGPQR